MLPPLPVPCGSHPDLLLKPPKPAPPPCLCPAISTAQIHFLWHPHTLLFPFPSSQQASLALYLNHPIRWWVSPSSHHPVPCFTAVFLAHLILITSASLAACAHWLALGCFPHSMPLEAWSLPQVIPAATLCYIQSLDSLSSSPWGQTLGDLRWVRPPFPSSPFWSHDHGAAERLEEATCSLPLALSHPAGPLGKGECNPDTIGLSQNHTPQTISWQNMGQLER